MLTIRREQMKAFEKAFEKRFISEALSGLSKSMPAECEQLGRESLHRLAEKAVRKCERYGIDEEDLILRFALLQLSEGEDFDFSPQSPWALPILRDEASDQHDKLDRLELESFTCTALKFIRSGQPGFLQEHGEKGVRDTIAEARSKCLRYRLDTRRQGIRFLQLMCVLGDDFDTRDEWAARILSEENLDPAEKVRLMEEASRAPMSPIPDGT